MPCAPEIAASACWCLPPRWPGICKIRWRATVSFSPGPHPDALLLRRELGGRPCASARPGGLPHGGRGGAARSAAGIRARGGHRGLLRIARQNHRGIRFRRVRQRATGAAVCPMRPWRRPFWRSTGNSTACSRIVVFRCARAAWSARPSASRARARAASEPSGWTASTLCPTRNCASSPRSAVMPTSP